MLSQNKNLLQAKNKNLPLTFFSIFCFLIELLVLGGKNPKNPTATEMPFNLLSKTGNLTHRDKKASAEQCYLVLLLNQAKAFGISPTETLTRGKTDTFFWVPNTGRQ